MQRRAAALYAAFFLVIAAGAYGTLGVAQEPEISLDNPDFTASSGQTIAVDGRTYTVSVGDGSADLTWVNESARYTQTWTATTRNVSSAAALGYLAGEDAPTVDYRNATYRAVVPSSTGDPSSFYLVETRSIPEDVSTVTVEDTTYVVLGDGDRTLVPAEEYLITQFGEPIVLDLGEGDTLPHQNQTATVTAVTNSSVEIAWIAPRENTVSVEEGDQVTLNGREFVAHFDGGRLMLTTDLGAYEEQVAIQDHYEERVNGLWGVSILSGLAAILLLSMSFLPSRY